MDFSIANLFGGNNSAPVAPVAPVANAPVQPGNLPPDGGTPAPATPGTDVNGAIPPIDPAAPTVPDSPLDQYKSLWEDVPTKEGELPATPAALDPTKLQDIISKADFTKALTQENLAKVAAGGEDAIAAVTAYIHSLDQQVVMQDTRASNKMTAQVVEAADAAYSASLPDLIRSQTTANALTKAKPVFQNPAVKPVIEAVQAQLARKNPDATADQLTEMAQSFVAVMGESFSPKPAADPSAPGAPDTMDWAKFLNG